MQTLDVYINAIPASELTIDGEAVSERDFEQVYHRYKDMVYNYLLYLTDDPDRAADLYQESMMKIYKNLENQTEVFALKSWIYKVVRNTYLDDQRKRRRIRKFLIWQDPDGDKMAEKREEELQNPDSQLESKETNLILHRIIAKLPPDQREVIVMHYIWELSFREIAVYLDLSINTVSARARYGLQKIRVSLGAIK
jgi:RNA polymerase sigma factor (sigma-70 family)